MIKIHKTNISDCILIEYNQFQDHRGYFSELYKASELSFLKPVQTNYSFSKKGVLRGIHRTPYAKLVSCVYGSVFDVCVDLRENSPTYKQHYSVELNSHNHNSLYIPNYCGHGFIANEDSIVVYHQDAEYNADTDEVFCYDDFHIAWPISSNDQLLLSSRDKGSCGGKY